MKIELFDSEASIPEPVLRLKLVMYGKTASVVAVDENGDTLHASHLLEIRPNGKVYRCQNVSQKLGLPLDYKNRITLTGE